ncbi:MAG: lysophospholipid acyltransferase family protein [Candidatus Gastranaerophilales bacterium]|nr:lysophospholipid acyltransferase family protein [Candidatus Gastranaerophilales bacterium]
MKWQKTLMSFYVNHQLFLINDYNGVLMEHREYNNKEKIMIPVLSNLAYSYIGIMDKSLRAKVINYNSQLSPVIYAVWHGWQYGLLTLPERKKLHLLISPSNDGEIISRVSNKLGFPTIRGSQGRDGTRALRNILKTLKSGGSLAYTVDGPKGPIYEVKSGIIQIAQMAQVPIIPFVPYVKHRIQAKSWDLYKVPHFFAKVNSVLGDPICIPRNISEEQKEEYRKQLEDKLLEIRNVADKGMI